MDNLFRRIILAYDGSEGGKKALQLTLGIVAQNTGVELTVVNVYDEKIGSKQMDSIHVEPPALNGYLLEGIQLPPLPIKQGFNEKTTHTIIKNSVDQILFEAKQALENSPFISVDYIILEGSPADAICELAEKFEADLIVAGSSGTGGLRRMFLGSVTGNIIKNAPCHVLVAK